MTASARTSPFGRELRRWRAMRGLSQLRLAAAASMSSRHLSFVETGRSRPSQAVVLRLADVLDVPLRERNRLLEAAGLAPAYAERTLDEAGLAPFRHVVRLLLERHAPYPGIVLDRAYRVVDANDAARALIPGLEGRSWIAATFGPESPVRATLVNFGEVAHATLDVLRRELAGGAPVDALVADLEAYLEGTPRPGPDASSAPVVTVRLRAGAQTLALLSTIVRFGTPRDVTLDELRVELFFPADAATAAFFERGRALDATA